MSDLQEFAAVRRRLAQAETRLGELEGVADELCDALVTLSDSEGVPEHLRRQVDAALDGYDAARVASRRSFLTH